MPSRDFTNEDLFSSLMMSMHNSTHSSQMNTVGPAMSLCTSCWFLPQNEQRSSFLVSTLRSLHISEPRKIQVITAVIRRTTPGAHTIDEVENALDRQMTAPRQPQLSKTEL